MTDIQNTNSTKTQVIVRLAYDNYEIHDCVERNSGPGYESYVEQCPDIEADLWTLFGHIPGQGLESIIDCGTREHAEEVFYRITGRDYGSQCEEVKGQRDAVPA